MKSLCKTFHQRILSVHTFALSIVLIVSLLGCGGGGGGGSNGLGVTASPLSETIPASLAKIS
ncbi:MAG TPA: hypothetical protein PLM07_18170, partial [Candidatus Rifleibacterium sp.]|nr:hypothetical protein [Candidatus Rifleibacterium sp.]